MGESLRQLLGGFVLSFISLALLILNWFFKYFNHQLYLELVLWSLWTVIALWHGIRLFPKTARTMWLLRMLLLTIIVAAAALLYSVEDPNVSLCFFWHVLITPRRKAGAGEYPPLAFIRVYQD